MQYKINIEKLPFPVGAVLHHSSSGRPTAASRQKSVNFCMLFLLKSVFLHSYFLLKSVK